MLLFIMLLLFLPDAQAYELAMNYGHQEVSMCSNGIVNQSFNSDQSVFNCSNKVLFTMSQTQEQFQNHSSEILIFTNISAPLTFNLRTEYGINSPYLNQSACPVGAQCIIEVHNNCTTISYFRFFDISILSVSSQHGPTQTFSYNLICYHYGVVNEFEAGMIILIFYSFVVIAYASRHANTESWNTEFEIGYYSIVGLCVVLAIIVYFVFSPIEESTAIISLVVLILSAIYGIFSVMVCFTELVCTFKYMRLQFFYKIKIRVMDIIGLLLGSGIFAAWLLLDYNFIIGDLIFTCMLVCTIKLFKFTSLKIAVFCFILTTSVYLTFILLTYFIQGHQNINSVFLSIFNNPFLLLCPVLTPVPNQQCSWLSLFSLAFPGLTLAYLQGFDGSRKTRVYEIVFMICYLIMSILWNALNVAIPVTLPFDLITSPVIIVTLCLFANRRNELNVLWNGEFSRESSHKDLSELVIFINNERKVSEISYFNRPTFDQGLRVNTNFSGFSESSSGRNSLLIQTTL